MKFIFDHWKPIAKFAYEHFLQFGLGAVVISDEATSLDHLNYVRVSEILSVIDGGQLLSSNGHPLASIDSLVYDFPLADYPRVFLTTERQRQQFQELVNSDPDYGVLYIYLSGPIARLGHCGNIFDCPARVYNLERNPEVNYFPGAIPFSNVLENDKRSREHYSQHLQAMAEPVLANFHEASREAYRFLWLRSFHHPLAVRVEKDELACSIFTKELDGVGGYYPKRNSKHTSNYLAPEQWGQVVSLIEKSHFWQSPSYRSYLGLDGADWVLEGYHNRSYHVVTRWSPDPKGEDKDFREVCLYLLKLSGINVPVSEVY